MSEALHYFLHNSADEIDIVKIIPRTFVERHEPVDRYTDVVRVDPSLPGYPLWRIAWCV